MTLPKSSHHHHSLAVLTLPGFLLFSQHAPAASDPHAPCSPGKGTGLLSNLVVYEGRGLEAISFELGRLDVEAIFGPAEGGSEKYLSYESSGIQICFCGDKVKDIHFQSAFRGKLYGSGLGIGNKLDEVMAAYGEIKDEKVVDSVCAWKLDRVLLVRAAENATDEPAYKLFYYDLGMFFLFDDDESLTEFGVYKCRSD